MVLPCHPHFLGTVVGQVPVQVQGAEVGAVPQVGLAPVQVPEVEVGLVPELVPGMEVGLVPVLVYLAPGILGAEDGPVLVPEYLLQMELVLDLIQTIRIIQIMEV